MTVQEWIREGEAQLRLGPHPERARRDAELLLQNVIRRERAALLARWREKLDENEVEDSGQTCHRPGEPGPAQIDRRQQS